MISKVEITEKDIKNIIEAYYFMDKHVKDKIFGKIYTLFFQTQDCFVKDKLVDFVVKVENLTAEKLAQRVILQT